MGIMKTATIGAGGTITIPEELLVEAGFKPGTPLEITATDGHIEIDLPTSRVRLEKRGPSDGSRSDRAHRRADTQH